MSAEFLESHCRAMYRFLGHSGFYTRMGSLECATKRYEDKLLQGEDEVIEYARRWNGKRNIFIGRNVRDKDSRVIDSNCVSFDIDPIREKGLASTNDQHNSALTVGRKILEAYPGGYLSSSGNGALLLFHVPSNVFGQDFDEYYRREASFIKELNETFGERYRVKIDATNYQEAMLKFIGTMSTKGQIDLRRCSRFIQFPIQPLSTSSRLLKRLNDIKPVEQVVKESIDINSLKSNFDGDRSKADFYLVNYLHKSGVNASVAAKLLSVNPLGRQNDEVDQARIISKVYGQVSTATPLSYFDKLFEKDNQDRSIITTGFKSLDKILGPLPKGEITTFAARSGYGKTTFGCTMAEELRKRGHKVLYFSTEMSEEYIMHKLVSIACNIPLEKVIQRADIHMEIIQPFRKSFEKIPLMICDIFQPSVEEVKAEIIKQQPDIVILDHFTHIETHWEKQMQYLNSLKEIAKNEALPIILLNELGEPPRGSNGEEQKSLRSDIRGTQHLLYISANLIFITNPFEVKGDFQPVEFHIAKNRYGMAAGKVVTLTLDKIISKFIERETIDEA